MTVTITSKGQITIPLRLRKKFHLNVGDQLEFDEEAPALVARRVVNRGEWEQTFGQWQNSANKALKRHPWKDQHSSTIIDDLRGGPVQDTKPMKRKR